MSRYWQQYGFPAFTPVIKNIIIINVIVWCAQSFTGAAFSESLDNFFALHSFYSPYFKVWQFITYMFMHSPLHSDLGITHILFNMLGLWMFGSALEMQFGGKKFLIFYLLCGIGAGIIYDLYMQFQLADVYQSLKALQAQGIINDVYANNIAEINDAMIGASGAVFGVLAAFTYLFPNTSILGPITLFIPVKVKWGFSIYVGYELFATIHHFEGDTVAHAAHLGGALIGFLLIYFWNKFDRRHFY